MRKHANIPIFIPHEGCKNECVFCNQRTITGTCHGSDRDISGEIECALSTIPDGYDIEIAFFGGSFTGIGNDRMTNLLDTAYKYVKVGKVQSIRLSTRPDYIDEEILDILLSRGVTHIELGIQSMKQNVLDECKRGHTITDTERACALINEYGFILGGQMMIGLPSSSCEDEIYTAEKIVQMGAKESRIYPCVVFENTELCRMAKSGKYVPLNIDDAGKRSAAVYDVFKKNNIKVLRIGLQSSENLSDEKEVYSGANHPAMGELVLGEYYLGKILERLDEIKSLSTPDDKNTLIIYCSKSNVSKLSGQNKRNKLRILSEIKAYGYVDIKIIGMDGFNNDKIAFDCENIQKAEEIKCT